MKKIVILCDPPASVFDFSEEHIQTPKETVVVRDVQRGRDELGSTSKKTFSFPSLSLSLPCTPYPLNRTGRERAADRLLAAERLGQGLARWCANRKAFAFYRITSGVAMVAAEVDVRERTRRALREAGEGARKAQKAAVEVRVPECRPCCTHPPMGVFHRDHSLYCSRYEAFPEFPTRMKL